MTRKQFPEYLHHPFSNISETRTVALIPSCPRDRVVFGEEPGHAAVSEEG